MEKGEQLAPEEINPVENLKKISPGEELIERIKKEDKEAANKKEEIVAETEPEPESEFAPSLIKNGVEVVDVKAVQKRFKTDKFGIPVSDNRPTWDKL